MDYENLFPNSTPITSVQGTLLAIIVIWSLIWKGLSLWKAAKKGDTGWYIALLILNTIGILEIVYYFFFSREKKEEKK